MLRVYPLSPMEVDQASHLKKGEFQSLTFLGTSLLLF